MLSLATTAHAADERSTPQATEEQCATLWSGYWKTQDMIQSLNGCLTWKCNLARGQAMALADKIAALAEDADCDRFRWWAPLAAISSPLGAER